MRVKNSYDVIVVGDELGGLLAATACAKRGQKVLVLEPDRPSELAYEVPSGRFLGDFHCRPVLGWVENSELDHFLRGLGIYQDRQELFPFHSPSLQWVGSKFRMDIDFAESTLRECSREMGPRGDSIGRTLLGELEGKFFSEGLAKRDLPPQWKEVGAVIPLLFGSLYSKEPELLSYQQTVGLARSGVYYINGGIVGLKEKILSRFRLYGGNIKKSAAVEEVVFERGKLAGVLLSSFEGFVKTKALLGAMPLGAFYCLFPEEHRKSFLSQRVQNREPKWLRWTLNSLVKHSELPEGIGSHLLFLSKFGEVPVQIQLLPRESYGGLSPGDSALVIRSLFPYASRNRPQLLKQSLEQVCESLGARLLRSMGFPLRPSLDSFVSDPLYARFFNDDFWSASSAFIYDEPAFSSPKEAMLWGPHGYDHIYLASSDVNPHLGVTGDLFTGLDLSKSLQAYI